MARTVGETRRSTVAGERVAAFVPHPLPPSDPPLALDPVRDVLSRAEHALSRLDLAGEMVPSLDWFTLGWRTRLVAPAVRTSLFAIASTPRPPMSAWRATSRASRRQRRAWP